MKCIITTLLLFLFQGVLLAQQTPKVLLSGYVYETKNQNYLKKVNVTIMSEDRKHEFKTTTDLDGKFQLEIPITGGVYFVKAEKKAFKGVMTKVSTKGYKNKEKVFARLRMDRLPGYILEMSFIDLANIDERVTSVNGIGNVHVEVYNNSTKEEVLNIPNHPTHIVECLLEQGYEYIFLIRKEGYYSKYMRANVNVNGCILCMEGFGAMTPGTQVNLTKKNKRGTLRAGVGMKKIELNKPIKMDNIYYDLGKATLRPTAYKALDKLVRMMRENPQIIIELSAYTDCRGSDEDNLDLSQRRANSVVNYIKSKVKLKWNQIKAKGYGESRPLNKCIDGVECSDELHQQNRRTELTITDILVEDPDMVHSLVAIMEKRNVSFK